MSRVIACVVALTLLAAGCGARTSGAGQQAGGGPGAAGNVSAVASVFPLAWVAQQVAPEATVELLNRGSQEAHDIELSPAQRAATETSDVVLYLGDLDYQPQVEEATGSAGGQVVDVAEVAGEQRLRASNGDHPHEHDGEDAHADEQTAVDPHVWFDAAVMADVAQRTGEAFAEADPDNADSYTANARAVADEFTALEDQLDDLLGGKCRFDEAIVSHTAYAYLVAPRGKELHGIGGVDPEAGASGGELAELVAEVRDEGFTHVLAEPVEGRRDAEALANEADVELLDIYPLDAVTDEQAETSFPDLVREQAETFATAYGCS
ncbi:MAG: metal ABC transporter substrate-binding protein [Egibacteraceae bacterium]